MQIVSNRDTLHEMTNLWGGGGVGWGAGRIFVPLTFTTFWANSADDKLEIAVYYPENRIWHFMQIIFIHHENTPI